MNNNTYLFKIIYVVLLTTLLSALSLTVFAEKSPKLNASISNECVPRKGFYGDPGSATAGAIIKVYSYDWSQLTANAGSIFASGIVTANSDGSWVWKCNGSNSCTAGANNCITNGTYAVTQTAPGKTESDPIFICVGSSNQSSKPVITGTNFSASGTVSGNAGNNAGVTIYTRNGATYNKIGFTNANSTGQWTITGLAITPCDTLTALSVEPTMCLSAYADAKTEGGIQQVSISSSRGTSACVGDTVVLTASQSSGISWSTGATTQTIQVLNSGTVTVTYSAGAGCSNQASTTLTFHNLPPTPVVYSVAGNEHCDGDTLTLYTNTMSGMNYSWRRFGFTVSGATDTALVITSPARYYASYIDANGCRSESDTFQVIRGPIEPVLSVTNNATICNSTPVVISTNPIPGVTYQWRNYSNNVAGATGPSLSTLNTGRYSLVVTNARGCNRSSGSVDVNITPQKPTLSGTGSLAVCAGSGMKLVTPLVADMTYQWKRNSRNITGGTTNTIFTAGEGYFRVVVTDTNGCSRASDSVQVYFSPAKPVITATGPTTFCPGDSVVLQANTIANVDYVWKRWAVNVPNSNQTSLTVKTTGKYRVQVTDMKGCTRTSDAIDVTTACREAMEPMPDADQLKVFPNPTNDLFQISLLGHQPEDIQIEILNTIGSAVPFKSEATAEGTIKVDVLVPGIYFAKIKGRDTIKVMRIIRE